MRLIIIYDKAPSRATTIGSGSTRGTTALPDEAILSGKYRTNRPLLLDSSLFSQLGSPRARVSIRTIFSYRSRSSFRYTSFQSYLFTKRSLEKERERENSATKLASRIAARGIAVEIVATLQRDGDAEEEERVDCARLSYNAKNIR